MISDLATPSDQYMSCNSRIPPLKRTYEGVGGFFFFFNYCWNFLKKDVLFLPSHSFTVPSRSIEQTEGDKYYFNPLSAFP